MQKLADFIWFNGKLIPWDESKIHVMTHGLHYSGAVYEGERAYSGKIFKLREHSERLIYSAKNIGLDFDYSVQEIMDICNLVIEKNNLQNAYIRPLVWRGSEAIKMYHDTLTTNFMVAAIPSNPEFRQDIRLNIGKWRKMDPRSFDPQIKSSAVYATAVLMLKEAKQQGFDDCILLDLDDNIAECAVSNIFFAKGKSIHTPVVGSFLNGITRQFVIKMLSEMGFAVEEKKISLNDIDQYDSCFMTGTAVEIAGVAMIDTGSNVQNFSNPIINDLQKKFAKEVGKICESECAKSF